MSGAASNLQWYLEFVAAYLERTSFVHIIFGVQKKFEHCTFRDYVFYCLFSNTWRTSNNASPDTSADSTSCNEKTSLAIRLDTNCFSISADKSWMRHLTVFSVNKKVQLDATVCRHLFTAPSLYMFWVSQHPSSGVQKLYLLPLV